MALPLEVGEEIERDELLRQLTQMQYARNNLDFRRGTFRARGDVIEVFPAYEEDRVIRVELFGDEVEAITSRSTRCAARSSASSSAHHIYPAGHYVTEGPRRWRASRLIEAELAERLATSCAARASCSRHSGSSSAPATTSSCCARSASATGSRTTRAWMDGREAKASRPSR